MTTSLIDADLIAYRCAASANTEAVDVAIQRCDSLMRDILEATQASSYKAFITGGGNFRYQINPNYKANRTDQVPPVHLQVCREFLVTEWKCKISTGKEADDDLGLAQTEDTIICSLDKDMRTVPGKHYSWAITGTVNGKQWVREEEFTEITPIGAACNFWKQLLIGDKADNLFGVDGIGKVRAAKLLESLTTEQEMFDVVYPLYDSDERFLMNGICFYILQQKELIWLNNLKKLTLPARLEQEVEVKLEFMKSLMEDNV